MRDTILAYVRREFLEAGSDAEIDATTPLVSSGIIDSFSMLGLKLFLERRYGVLIPNEQATPRAFETVESIVALVERSLAPA